MVNVRIEIREGSVKGDEKFNVAMIVGKDSVLEANVEYCPCCFYKLDVTKKKVQKLMLACFELEHARTGKVSKEHESFLAGDVYNFNIILENKIVDDKLPLMNGIVIKEKHVIKEETDILKSLHDNMMFAKTIADIKNNISKKECNGEKSIFGTKRKEDKSEAEKLFEEVFKKPMFTDEEKARNKTSEKLVSEMEMMFKIMTSKVKLSKEEFFNKDGSRRPVEEVYQTVQDKLKDSVVKSDGTSTKEESDELKKATNFMESPDPRLEALKKINGYFEKLVDSLGIKDNGIKISKPVRETQENSLKDNTVFDKVRKIPAYDLTNKDNRMILTLGSKMYLFNNIHVYYREGDIVKRAYLNIDQNGLFSSNLSFVNFENLLKNNVFYHVENLEQIKFLKDIFPTMLGMMEFKPDIVLYKGGEGFPVGFPNIESFKKYDKELPYHIVTNFYTFLPVSNYQELIVRKGIEKRTEELVEQFKENDTIKPNECCSSTTEIKESVDVYVDLDKDGKLTHGNKPLLFSTLIPVNNKPLFKVDISSDNGVSCLEYLDSGFLKICAVGDNPLKNKYYLTKEVCEFLKNIGYGYTDSTFLPVTYTKPEVNKIKDDVTQIFLAIDKEDTYKWTTIPLPNNTYSVIDLRFPLGLKALNYLLTRFDVKRTTKIYLNQDVCEHLLEMFGEIYFIEASISSILKDMNTNLEDKTTTSEIIYIRVYKGELLATTIPQVANKFYTISNEQSDDDIKKIIDYFNSLIIKEVKVDKFLITKSALALLSKSDEWSHIKFEEYKNEETK